LRAKRLAQSRPRISRHPKHRIARTRFPGPRSQHRHAAMRVRCLPASGPRGDWDSPSSQAGSVQAFGWPRTLGGLVEFQSALNNTLDALESVHIPHGHRHLGAGHGPSPVSDKGLKRRARLRRKGTPVLSRKRTSVFSVHTLTSHKVYYGKSRLYWIVHVPGLASHTSPLFYCFQPGRKTSAAARRVRAHLPAF
jgi:hypothetical protein